MPHFGLEQELDGWVAGVDEVGRGPLAGPVMAAAVLFVREVPPSLMDTLDDSKKLTIKQRRRIFDILAKDPDVIIGVGLATVPEIDRLNIREATFLAMWRAVKHLIFHPDHILVDGNAAPAWPYSTRCVIGGDGISLSIAAASVVAKICRDKLMHQLALRWPGYGWERNAGYPTAFHLEALSKQGITRHHRMGFGPVRDVLNNQHFLSSSLNKTN